MIQVVVNHESGQQRNDCSVRTLWSLSGRSYSECLEIMREAGRQDNRGAYVWNIEHAYKTIGAKWTNLWGKKPTFNQWYKTADHSKNYAVMVRGHIFAVRKGVVYGNESDASRLRARVSQFAEVKEFEAPAIQSVEDKAKDEKRETIKLAIEKAKDKAAVYGSVSIGGKKLVAKHYPSEKAFNKAIDNAVRNAYKKLIEKK